MIKFVSGITASVRYRLRQLTIPLQCWVFSLQARFGRRSVTAPNGPIVSLTSHGDRLDVCHISVESIARGHMRPSRLILWVDDRARIEAPSSALKNLINRGLEMRIAENFGPHTKYFPYVTSSTSLETPLVTADDDVLYPRSWLRRLLRRHEDAPSAVVAYRARRIRLRGTRGLQPYADWPFSTERAPSVLNFATGHSGVLYPADFQRELRRRGDAFLEVCPRADDVWLHNTAVRTGTPIALVGRRSREFTTVDRTQALALKHSNVANGMNDAQIASTYTMAEIAALVESAAGEPHR